MNPTLEQINSVRSQAGFAPLSSVPTSNGSTPKPVQSLSEKYGWSKPKEISPLQSIGEETKSQFLQGGEKILSSVGQGSETISKGLNAQKPEDLLNIPIGMAQAGAGAVAGAGQVIFSPITALVSKFAEKFGKDAKDPINQNRPLYENPVMGKVLDVFGSVSGSLDKVAQEHPEQAGLISDTLNAALTMLAAKGMDNSALGKTKVSDAAGKVTDVGSEIIGGVKGTVSDIVGGTKNKITGIFKGKTPEEILATPENKLQKLSSEDRGVYFDTQRESLKVKHDTAQEKITTKSAEMEKQIKTESQANQQKLKDETKSLQAQAERSSYEEVQAMKPKVIKSFSESSKTYRELVDKEISQHADTKVTPQEIRDFVDNRFSEDPTKAKQIKERLGITEPVGETQPTGMTVAEEKPVSIGDIYNNTKSLRQDIGRAATKGQRVFTPDEMVTDQSISTLSDFLKSQGVDLSEANKFWSDYAPLRDKIVSKVQPFKPRGAETESFTTSREMQSYVKGAAQAGKADFFKALEDLLGTKVGNPELKGLIEKLNANDRAKFVAKFEEETKLSDAKMFKEQQIKETESQFKGEGKKISDQEFEVSRKAQTRANIIKALKWIGVTGITLEEIHRVTGF